jgi:cytoskeletal protein RodZ
VADGKSEISGASGGGRGEVSLGKLLTEARKNGGFTSEQVAAETHIPPHYVKAIETDDYGMISDQLYLLPFLRRYAAFIGLDPEDVASRFVREVQKAESSSGKASEPIPMITNERKPGSGGRYGLAIVVLLVLAGLAALLAWKREALMQHVLHLSKRTPPSVEPAASASPAAQASTSAAAASKDMAAPSSAAARTSDSTGV